MPKYDASRFRCNNCGEFYHTEQARDKCEAGHNSEE